MHSECKYTISKTCITGKKIHKKYSKAELMEKKATIFIFQPIILPKIGVIRQNGWGGGNDDISITP